MQQWTLSRKPRKILSINFRASSTKRETPLNFSSKDEDIVQPLLKDYGFF